MIFGLGASHAVGNHILMDSDEAGAGCVGLGENSIREKVGRGIGRRVSQ